MIYLESGTTGKSPAKFAKSFLKNLHDRLEPHSLGLFLLLLALLSIYRNVDRFIDENDNLIGGIVVAGGGDVYKDFISQHTPFMYYLCALYRLLGAFAVPHFRMMFYATLALLWVFMYNRYSRHFGRLAMAVYPLAYIFMMASISRYGHMVLSEQLQAQGIVLLMLEFLLFLRSGELSRGSRRIIALAILISFGTAFVSIFAIAVIFLGVAAYEVMHLRRQRRGLAASCRLVTRKYGLMVALTAAPFVLLLAVYLLEGNLRNAYYGAYRINVDIYPRYLKQFTSNIVVSLLELVDSYFTTITSRIGDLFTNTVYSLRILLNAVINLLFLAYAYDRFKAYAVFFAGLIFASGIRGYQEFHAIPYWAITIMMGAILLQETGMPQVRSFYYRIGSRQLALALLLLLLTAPYLTRFSAVKPSRAELGMAPPEGSYASVIRHLTAADERIFVNTLDTTFYLESGRMPATRDIGGGITPWTYEMFGHTVLPDLEKYKPKVAIFKEGYDVWGYKNTDTQPEIVNYVKDNYTPLRVYQLDMLYVRNDFYPEACRILNLTPQLKP